jgi:hypothetical protein
LVTIMGDLAAKFPSLAATGSLAPGVSPNSALFGKSFVSEKDIDLEKRELVRDRGSGTRGGGGRRGAQSSLRTSQ